MFVENVDRCLGGRLTGGVMRSRRQSEIKSPILMLQSVCIHRLGALFLRHRFTGKLLLMLSAARPAALSAGLTRFLTAPFVSGSSQVRRSPALAGNFTLLSTVHRRKTAIFYTHNVLIHQNALVISTASQGTTWVQPMCRDELPLQTGLLCLRTRGASSRRSPAASGMGYVGTVISTRRVRGSLSGRTRAGSQAAGA